LRILLLNDGLILGIELKYGALKTVSTTKLAKEYLGVTQGELWSVLISDGYLTESRKLTDKGIKAGGIPKNFNGTDYVAWPLNFDPLKRKLIGVKDIGSEWGISAQRVNRLFNSRGFIEKATLGWSITKLGRRFGGVEKEYTPTGAKYVLWPEETVFGNKHFEELVSSTDVHENETNSTEVSHEEKEPAKLSKGRYKTKDGHFVRSRAEVIIDNYLFECNLPHAYERSLPIEEDMFCDWYIPPFGMNSSKPVYIEFWGMDTDKYLERKKEKQLIYRKYPELHLIELEDKDLDDLDRVLSSKLTQVGINVANT